MINNFLDRVLYFKEISDSYSPSEREVIRGELIKEADENIKRLNKQLGNSKNY